MDVRVAGADDMGQLAGLLGRFDGREQPAGPEPVFAAELLRWWGANQTSHVPFLGVIPPGAAVGMAWLAIAARVPRPAGRVGCAATSRASTSFPSTGRPASGPL